MKRRKFLAITGASAAGLVLSVGAFGVTLPGMEKLIVSMVKEDVSQLNVKQEDIKRYAADVVKHDPFRFGDKKWKFLAAYSRLKPLGLPLPYEGLYTELRSIVTGNFLLSTNYFWEKLGDNDEVKYSGRIFTPYNYPCGNPFSNLYYPNIT
ncbi:hypothetical protein [Chryseosolibacter indicus]|uniref:Uncharacterized protein n=1 Tax=Chryseosolibacter indicus TaxID=2782351 RepID=A0ABS5VSJ1_9BACT|nr:hypothetical protein [Chryseosolibacter indicus]MBT1703805.1 hypothetical protein [Chryseosolibacter indicus]